MATVLVTGGAGFIGSNVAVALAKRGDRIRVLDDLSTGFRINLKPSLDALEIFEGSINDDELLRKAMEDVEVCLHFAAINSVPRSIALPKAVNRANVDGSVNVFITARDAGVKRVIAASSSSVCGTREGGASDENFPYAPISPYSVSKTAMEHYARVFADTYDMEIAVFRYFNVFGPRQNPSSAYSAVIPKFIKRLLNCDKPTIHGDGSQSRDFTYVDNVVEANLLGVDCPSRLVGVYNIACGGNTTVLELTRTLMEIMGVDGEPNFDAPRPGDIRFSQANIEKARSVLGYEPKVSVREGLERTVAWFRENPPGV
mgnify:CR=1 FL=1